jgi:cephalosporin hydroxylase
MFEAAAPWSPWLGVRTLKNPLDLWVYQEILFETRPEVIVETGTHRGGSALYLASLCDLLGTGTVVTIDIEPVADDYPSHPRIVYLGGRSSTDDAVVAEVAALVRGRRAMVILDSDHSQRHVEAELGAYARFVSEGCYLVVEDSNLGIIRPELLPGPGEALEGFLAGTSEFEVDRSRERFLLTYNDGGYLRRIAPASSLAPESDAQPPATAAVTPVSANAA